MQHEVPIKADGVWRWKRACITPYDPTKDENCSASRTANTSGMPTYTREAMIEDDLLFDWCIGLIVAMHHRDIYCSGSNVRTARSGPAPKRTGGRLLSFVLGKRGSASWISNSSRRKRTNPLQRWTQRREALSAPRRAKWNSQVPSAPTTLAKYRPRFARRSTVGWRSGGSSPGTCPNLRERQFDERPEGDYPRAFSDPAWEPNDDW